MTDKTCSDCGLPVVWVLTEGARRIALNPDPVPDGTIVPVTVGGRRLARVLTGAQLPALEPAWVRHTKTCPGRTDAPTAPPGPRCAACHQPMPADLARLEQWTHHPCCDPHELAQLARAEIRPPAHKDTSC